VTHSLSARSTQLAGAPLELKHILQTESEDIEREMRLNRLRELADSSGDMKYASPTQSYTSRTLPWARCSPSTRTEGFPYKGAGNWSMCADFVPEVLLLLIISALNCECLTTPSPTTREGQ
jgi:hypothetical protein